MSLTNERSHKDKGETRVLPMRGMEAAALGVASAKRSRRTKNARKMFMPAIKTIPITVALRHTPLTVAHVLVAKQDPG